MGFITRCFFWVVDLIADAGEFIEKLTSPVPFEYVATHKTRRQKVFYVVAFLAIFYSVTHTYEWLQYTFPRPGGEIFSYSFVRSPGKIVDYGILLPTVFLRALAWVPHAFAYLFCGTVGGICKLDQSQGGIALNFWLAQAWPLDGQGYFIWLKPSLTVWSDMYWYMSWVVTMLVFTAQAKTVRFIGHNALKMIAQEEMKKTTVQWREGALPSARPAVMRANLHGVFAVGLGIFMAVCGWGFELHMMTSSLQDSALAQAQSGGGWWYVLAVGLLPEVMFGMAAPKITQVRKDEHEQKIKQPHAGRNNKKRVHNQQKQTKNKSSQDLQAVRESLANIQANTGKK